MTGAFQTNLVRRSVDDYALFSNGICLDSCENKSPLAAIGDYFGQSSRLEFPTRSAGIHYGPNVGGEAASRAEIQNLSRHTAVRRASLGCHIAETLRSQGMIGTRAVALIKQVGFSKSTHIETIPTCGHRIVAKMHKVRGCIAQAETLNGKPISA